MNQNALTQRDRKSRRFAADSNVQSDTTTKNCCTNCEEVPSCTSLSCSDSGWSDTFIKVAGQTTAGTR